MQESISKIHGEMPVRRQDITERIVDLLDQGYTRSETLDKVVEWLKPWHPEHEVLDELPKLVDYLAE